MKESLFDTLLNLAVITCTIGFLMLGFALIKTEAACAGSTCCCQTRDGGLCCRDQTWCTGIILGCDCK